MNVTVHSMRTIGLASDTVQINVDYIQYAELGSLRDFAIVGMPDAAARETRVRILSAFSQLGIDLGGVRLTVTISPPLPHGAPHLDLPIAAGILAAIGQVPADALDGTVLLGELALSGNIRPIRGTLVYLDRAAKLGVSLAVVPLSNAREAYLAEGIHVWPVDTLSNLRDSLRKGRHVGAKVEALDDASEPAQRVAAFDMSEVFGQPIARRALEVAAAGGHRILLIGQPGSGKTMLARRLTSILPVMTNAEAREVTKIHSVAGLLPPEHGLVTQRPFRAPHHTVSETGLVGGGGGTAVSRPGEVTLAHNGVLFLDELTEFRQSTLLALDHALGKGETTFHSRHETGHYPARPLVIGAANPCPCGFAEDPFNRCRCAPESIKRHMERIRLGFDIRIRINAVPVTELQQGLGESSAVIRARVAAAHMARAERDRVKQDVARATRSNGSIEPNLNYRLARTIADLAGSLEVLPEHREEASALGAVRQRGTVTP